MWFKCIIYHCAPIAGQIEIIQVSLVEAEEKIHKLEGDLRHCYVLNINHVAHKE